MKKLILLISLFIFIQNIFAQESQKQEVLNTSEVLVKGSEVQLLQNKVITQNIKLDTLPETKNSIRFVCLGSTFPLEPLYVIDGVPLNADNFKAINPDDIISIDILKNAGATSIYGNRGENGVIIVKTKNGLTRKEKRKQKREAKRLAREQTNKS